MARLKGWLPFWEPPYHPNLEAFGGQPLGGGCLLVREKWPAKMAQRDPTCPLSEEPWHSGLWLPAIVVPSHGKRPLNILVVYGVAGDHRLNAKLWDAVLMYTAKLGNAPFIIATDSHVQLDNQESMPNPMLTEILFGCLVDVDLLHARANSINCQCYYHNGSQTQSPTRIDTLFADPKTASSVVRVEPTPNGHVPGRRPVTFTLNLKQSSQTVMKLIKVPPIAMAQNLDNSLSKDG